MKKILLFVSSLFLFLIVSVNVEAQETNINGYNITLPGSARLYDYVNTSTLDGKSWYANGTDNTITWQFNSDSISLGTLGIVISLPINTVPGHTYTFFYYFASNNSSYFSYHNIEESNRVFGLGNYLGDVIVSPKTKNATIDSMGMYASSQTIINSYDASYQYLTTAYITFTSTKSSNGNNLYFSSTNLSNESFHYRNYAFVGYTLIDITTLDSSEKSTLNAILNGVNTLNSTDVAGAIQEFNATQQETNNKIDETNSQLNDLNNNLNDSDTSDATNEAGDFFGGFQTDTFGLTSIITAPLNLIGSITSSSCSPLGLQVPFVENTTLNLPCMSTIYQNYFGSFLSVYQTITFGIVAYWVCVRIFALVKDFKNPDHDEIEVLDL